MSIHSAYFLSTTLRRAAICLIGQIAVGLSFLIMIVFPINLRADLSPSRLDRSLKALAQTERKKSLSVDVGYFLYPGQQYHGISIGADYVELLDERFALIWSPLPLGILYSTKRDAETESAVSWRLDVNTRFNGSVAPQFDSFYRRHLSPG